MQQIHAAICLISTRKSVSAQSWFPGQRKLEISVGVTRNQLGCSCRGRVLIWSANFLSLLESLLHTVSTIMSSTDPCYGRHYASFLLPKPAYADNRMGVYMHAWDNQMVWTLDCDAVYYTADNRRFITSVLARGSQRQQAHRLQATRQTPNNAKRKKPPSVNAKRKRWPAAHMRSLR